MGLSLKVRKEDANSAIIDVEKNNLLDKSRKITKEEDHVFIPIKEEPEDVAVEYKLSEKKLVNRKKKRSFKEAISEILDEEEIKGVKTSYDVIGDIAVLEIDEGLRGKEKEIALKLLETNKTIRSVYRKDSAHEGPFRTQKMQHLAGDDDLETIHKENNTRIKLNIETVYFSMRQSTERKRIMQKVRDGEKVLVLFSGCAPFPCVIAKNRKPSIVCGVEINPEGHRYGLENIRLNRLRNVYLSNKDARDLAGIEKDFTGVVGYDGKFDRIMMPHPSDSISFLKSTLEFAKKGTTIHLYTFSDEDKLNDKADEVRKECKKHGKDIEVKSIVLSGQHSPGHYRICIDFKIR